MESIQYLEHRIHVQSTSNVCMQGKRGNIAAADLDELSSSTGCIVYEHLELYRCDRDAGLQNAAVMDVCFLRLFLSIVI